jgi:hypothetical protein
MEECKLVRILIDTNSKLLKLYDKKFGNVQRELEGIPYKVG